MGRSDLEGLKRTEVGEVQKLISLIFKGKWPEFRRKRDLYEPLLTAMARALPSPSHANLLKSGKVGEISALKGAHGLRVLCGI